MDLQETSVDQPTSTSTEPFLESAPNGTMKEGKNEEKTFFKKMEDPAYKKRVMHSLWMAVSCLALGMAIGQQGPTFLDLQIITDTDVETASFFFTSASFGYMVGSFISGQVHGKFNNSLMMFISTQGIAVSAVITPYCSHFVLMLLIRFMTNLFAGGIDTLTNAEHMQLWGTEGEMLLQLIHFSFALGGVLSPMYSEPFLTPKEVVNSTSESVWNVSTTATTMLNVTGLDTTPERTIRVHYAFLITGILCSLTGVPQIILFCKERGSETRDENKYNQDAKTRTLPKSLYIFIVAYLCFFYVVYCCVEDTFASYLMTFVVREYDEVTKSKGAYITTFYWASFATSRFLCIFIAKVLIAVRMIYLFTTLMIIAYTGFAVLAFMGSIDGLTCFAALAGLSMSAVFPSGFSWTETELMKVTGKISSCILIGSSFGMMLNPLAVGYLMEEVDNMWFCYLLLIQTIVLALTFYSLLLFNRFYVNPRYGSLGEVRAETQEEPVVT